MKQQFDTFDVMRLQVQDGWPDLPNLVLNPSGEGGAWGWICDTRFGAALSGDGELHLTKTATGSFQTAVAEFPITINPVTVAGSMQVRGSITINAASGPLDGDSPKVIVTAYDENGHIMNPAFVDIENLSVGTHPIPATNIPVGAVTLRVGVQVTANGAGTMAVDFSDVVLMVGTPSEIAASDPLSEPPWTNIMGPTSEITLERDELQVGVVTAVVFDASLDPATDTLIRPGKRVRLQALVSGQWEQLVGALIASPSTTYDLKNPETPDQKRTRIELVATDAVTTLANAPRSQSVATLAELPSMLIGTGVPWQVNGAGVALDPDEVEVVATNDNASAVDQIAMTRDTVSGYAWVDRDGVLQLWDRDEIPTGAAISLDEADYADLDTNWNLERVVNVIHVVAQATNAGTGETEETTFGPFEEPGSVREWGRRAARYTVVGVWDETRAREFAEDVFTANATPSVRVVSATIPIRTAADINTKATLDLYDKVLISNTRAGLVNEPARVTSVKHHIVARGNGESSWVVELKFAAENSVAQPQVVPGVQLGNSKNRVGEVTIWIGAYADIPDGWLALDGSTYDETVFPQLFERLGSNVLPDWTDRFPIGAGNKAPLTQGGQSTVTIAAETHLPLSDGAGGVGSKVPRGTNVNVKAAEPLDILNPWAACWFIVRAAGSAFTQEISGGTGGGGRGSLPYFMPEDYGTAGDGADSTAAIQEAIDAAAEAGGGTVFLSPTAYGISGPLQLKDHVGLLGCGANQGGSTLLALDDTAQIRFGDWATSQERIGLCSNFTIDGAGTGNPDGLAWFECVTSTFQAIAIKDAGGKAMVVHGAQNNTFISVDIFTPGDDSLTHDYGTGGNIHIRCEVHGSPGRALVLTRADALGVYPFLNAHNVFKHCIFETAVDGVSLVDVEASNTTRFEDCGFSQNANAVMSSGYLFRVLNNPAYPSTPGFTAVELVGGQFYGGQTTQADAIYVTGLNQLRVSGHTYFQNTPREFSTDGVATIEVDGAVQSVPSTQTRYHLLTGGATNGLATFRAQPLAIKPKLSSMAVLMAGRDTDNGYRGWVTRDMALAWGDGTTFVPTAATLGYNPTTGQIETTGGLLQSGRRGHAEQTYAPTAGASVACNTKTFSVHTITLLNNAGTITLTNPAAGAEVTIQVAQDAVGGRTITWPTAKYANGNPPTDTTPNSVTSVTLRYSGAAAAWYEIARAVGVR